MQSVAPAASSLSAMAEVEIELRLWQVGHGNNTGGISCKGAGF
jgi:hypothetical protein